MLDEMLHGNLQRQDVYLILNAVIIQRLKKKKLTACLQLVSHEEGYAQKYKPRHAKTCCHYFLNAIDEC
jgi:hypothetical protein